MQGYMRTTGNKQCWESGSASTTGTMWKTLLVVSLFCWGKCQESQNMTPEEKGVIRDQIVEMFDHAYGSYMKYAYPADELMPLSCRGRVRGQEPNRGDIDDSLGKFSLTLIDTLDTLVVLNKLDEFEEAVKKAVSDVRLDNDVVVSVFETNIRVLGGLLGGHVMADLLRQRGERMQWYRDELLHMAKELGHRLLPAFNTTSGLPYPKVNLRYGVLNPLSRTGTESDTCTACAGTMILEFAALSRLSGNSVFEEHARKALDVLWERRQRGSDLVGTVINIHNGEWVRRDSGVGAGIDSYYEYLMKAYILLGDNVFLDRFNVHYSAIMKYISQPPLLLNVHMHNPTVSVRSWMDSLLAFFPGLQVLRGDLKPAIETHEMLYQVTKQHKFLPEAFTTEFRVHWGQHLLRPEFAESTYYLYKATGDPYYLRVGQSIVEKLNAYARVPCGFAAVQDVRTGTHEDRMDSFFLAEMFKYLYLMFSEKSHLPIDMDGYIFTTEAHLLPISLSTTQPPCPGNDTMRERLEKMTELAQAHKAEAQQHQKAWYDQSARQRSFSPGQKVLVLLPSDDSKLLAKWQGPYEIQKKLGQTTYKVAIPDQPRSSRVLHINLLKEWVGRPKADVFLIREVSEEEEVDDQYLPKPTPQDLDLNHLPEERQAQVRNLCKLDVFSENPGRTDIVEHDIVLKDGASVKRMSYRIPERLLIPLKEEIDLMLSLGIIEASKSEWCHPVVLVPKKDGSIRFCIDFRYLNAISQFDSYPTPRIDDMVERLGKARYLTTIDLCKGYWQVPLTERSKELTAFRTPWGLFQFRVMPFGLHGAPATFQRLMDQVLSDMSDFAAAYLDDIVIFSSTWEEHLQHLEKVLGRLQSAGLTVNPAKCAIAKAETEYLGFVIGNGVIKPQVDKVTAIESCPLPETRKQLRSFLGMAGFYHRFIPHFSTRAALLTDLTGARSPNKITWTEEAKMAFQDLRQSLSKSPVLHSPDFERNFILQTDASERGLGAVLLQGPPGERHPVAFISRKLFPREVRYSTIEKEGLAIKWALDSFRYYLLGREFILETDHKALQWIERMKDTNGRITRWYLAIQPFRFTINHIPGKDNCTADCLSRCPRERSEEGECVMAALTATQW
ncbi:uncharacterized protein si:ch211-282j22.3 isoform X5 [Pelmatolapia mariae]|uniref:uncharacterized protein si:ch211-282j22.3 isoform X5 n=1 Tax=Pelmatolapia mariae TaxID=158779 RepID=UPI002FE52581